MSDKLLLATERRRRIAAEAEVAQLRAQLAARPAGTLAAPSIAPEVAQGLTQPVSQPRQTEEQLKYSQSFVRQVIDNSPNLVYVENEEGRCVLANKRYLQLLKQQACLTKLPEQPRLITTEAEESEALRPANASVSFEECYHFPDGQVIWYHTTKSPLVRSDGSRHLITFSSDITALKRAQQLAEESVQARQIFMANMSHEIRTPLHGVMGLTEILKKEALSPEQADYVEMIQDSTENLLVVINDILDFTKIESGKINLESIPFDILETVQNAARSLSFKVNEKGLTLRIISLTERLPLAQGDPFRLHQVLINLIGNAIKFTHHGTITITIDASQQAGMALPIIFSVTDTGIGISSDNIGHVFNSFRQADTSITRLYGGTGLGLTICKNLVELQGGQIGVSSTLQEGSNFYFTIPYTVSEELLVKEPTVSPQPFLLRGLRVLLAEDNAINQLIALSMLSQWQVKVDMVQNGEEAVAKAWQTTYDLILMDIKMPQLDGIKATAILRAEANPNQHTPIIALTADAMQVNADSCQKMGFSTCLTKPYTESALYKILAETSRRWADNLPLLTPDAPLAMLDSDLHYDFSILGKLADDTDFIRRMLELFIAGVPGQVERLQVAIKCQDWDTIAHEAHSLKTTFGSLNIQPTTKQLCRLEELADLQIFSSESLFLIDAVSENTQLFHKLFTEKLAHLAESPECQPTSQLANYEALQ